MTEGSRLPPGFVDLEKFLDYWDVSTSQERWARREAAPMEEITAFYHAVLPRLDDMQAYIDQYPLDALPEDAGRLMRLILALAHASIAVELHGRSKVLPNFHPQPLHVVAGFQPFG